MTNNAERENRSLRMRVCGLTDENGGDLSKNDRAEQSRASAACDAPVRAPSETPPPPRTYLSKGSLAASRCPPLPAAHMLIIGALLALNLQVQVRPDRQRRTIVRDSIADTVTTPPGRRRLVGHRLPVTAQVLATAF